MTFCDTQLKTALKYLENHYTLGNTYINILNYSSNTTFNHNKNTMYGKNLTQTTQILTSNKERVLV